MERNNCIFCKIVAGKAPSWKIYENDWVYAFLDIHPANKYHTLVIPKNHHRDIYDIPENELKEVIAVVKKLALLYKEKLGIENVQVISNNGAEAQQDVFHIHYHLLPRKASEDGQNVKWHTHPEWRSEFDTMLEKIQ